MKKLLMLFLLSVINMHAMEQDLNQTSSDENSSLQEKKVIAQDTLSDEEAPRLFKTIVNLLDDACNKIRVLHQRDKKTIPLFRHVTESLFSNNMLKLTYNPSDIIKKRIAQEMAKSRDKELSIDDEDTIQEGTILHKCFSEFAISYYRDIFKELDEIVPAIDNNRELSNQTDSELTP
jgi:hypothetical protein